MPPVLWFVICNHLSPLLKLVVRSRVAYCMALAQAGINYGPPGAKQLIYFVDDLNMPKLDAYETAMPISLIRQHL